MYVDSESFNRRAVKPMVCLREAWQVVKGEYWLLLGITFLGLLLGSLAALFLMGPAMCGIHYCFLRRERGQRVSFDMLFRGFDYFVQSLIATLIMTVPVIILSLAAYLLFVAGVFSMFAAMPRPAPGQPLAPEAIWLFVGLFAWYILALTVISLMPRVLFFFTYPLIVDRGLSGFEAVKLSIRAVFGNLWGVLGICLLIEVLGLVGLVFCFVGTFFFLPINVAMMSIAYRQVFEVEEKDFDDEFEPAALPGPVETGIQESPSTAVSPREP